MPGCAPSLLRRPGAPAGRPARSSSTAGTLRPRQSRGPPHEAPDRLAGSAGVRLTESLFDLGAGVSVDLQPYGDLDDDGGLPLHGHFPRSDLTRREGKVA